jgi:excisionase family DNA binding protein
MFKDSYELWGPLEVSEYLGIPVGTLYTWRYQGSGPPAYRVGRHLRYRRDEVEQWLADRRDPKTAPDMHRPTRGRPSTRRGRSP